jgi:hypothetical protein
MPRRCPAVYDRLIAQRPTELLPRYLYGRVAALSGDNAERGEREMRYWIANAPADAPLLTRSAAHVRLGMILEHEGKRAAARTEYEQPFRSTQERRREEAV